METLTVQAPQTLVADEAFDLVIGDLEQDVPGHRQDALPQATTCVRVYCVPNL
ncbi:hypothetical protein ACFV1L_05160 [Kitasatospora sp. NPDC059646]|uniref:Uncharacterized protein n=1 Tax=Kitasatospora cheerisanensis KCTC 2395 TaxID=1348663 RepID=A0A066YWQ1_9ACTN|nr:hypothetical protein [Kitasatospora cheerisanensis]KDN82355.1 hypothetical protein KCH_58620 [Kitasatospora cheerisanensis KCTC 2395]